jgi:hypothetical protein
MSTALRGHVGSHAADTLKSNACESKSGAWSPMRYALTNTRNYQNVQNVPVKINLRWSQVVWSHLLFVKLGEARRRRQHQAQRFWLAGYVEENEMRQSLRTTSCV